MKYVKFLGWNLFRNLVTDTKKNGMWYRYGQIVVKQILQNFTNRRLHCLINKSGNVRTYNVTLRRVLATIAAVESNTYYIFWVCVCSLSYLACTAHASYCHWWPVRLSNIFPRYLINGTILPPPKKNVIEHKVCFDFLYKFCLQQFSF